MFVDSHHYGKVIILNGTSSSGKTTLAKELQNRFTETYLHCSGDTFWNMTPAAIPASSATFPNLKLAMALSVKVLAKTGHNVIVDTIYLGTKTQQEMSIALGGLDVVTIGLMCPTNVLEDREKARGNRKIGLAKSQVLTAHEGVSYDLQIDTSQNTPNKCAKKIVNLMKRSKTNLRAPQHLTQQTPLKILY